MPKWALGITVEDMIWFWGLTAGVALGLEFATTTFYFGLLAVGSLGGLAAAAVGAPVIIQVPGDRGNYASGNFRDPPIGP